MVKTVLVPLDGSELAEGVLPYAEQIAEKTDAALLLLTSIYQPDTWVGYLAQVDMGKQTALVQTYLETKRDKLQGRGLKVKVDIAYGPEAESILNYAADENVDLIAMSTHGRSGISRWALGSVADKVLHGTHRPLLLVRASQQGAQPPVMGKILVPLDGSELSLAVLPFVEELARALSASVVLFHAVSPVGVYPGVETAQFRAGELLEQVQAQARQFLAHVAQEVQGRGLEVSNAIAIGFAADEIVRAARDMGVDLIAISTHGRSGLGRWVMGSVADAVVRRTTLPCLIVRPAQAQKAE